MKVTIPGKLYIAGEYGVIDGGHAILAPVRRSMHFDIRKSHADIIASKQIGVVKPSQANVPVTIFAPYAKALEFIKAKNILKKPFTLTIQSELDTPGFKLGLGSSGAFITGIIKSILAFHGVKVTPIELFKLSVLTQYDISKHTSFGDLSVHAYGTWVLYRKFDTDWLRNHRKDSIDLLVGRPWKGLKIYPFIPEAFHGFAVNSMVPSSSASLVHAYRTRLTNQEKDKVRRFTDKKTLAFYESMKSRPNWRHLQDIHEYLREVSNKKHLSIVTPALDYIVDSLTRLKGFSKFSGAGGGDCVIAFFDSSSTCL